MDVIGFRNTLELEAQLSKAIKKEEFQLYYQPKLNLNTGRIIGVEALIRWDHPKIGIISPSDFIPIAEVTGKILPIGEWVLRKACQQNKEWQNMGHPSMIMAVNLSASQLYQFNLVTMVQQILEETGLSAEFLELEITESMMMDVPKVLPLIKDLKSLGVKISLDDFGTGYSSLSYLKDFPIDIIKIDQSFVRKSNVDRKDGTIVKAIIAMAHQLQMDVVAEGVETKDNLIFLQQNLCNMGQGFFFSEPLPPYELVKKFNELEEIIPREGLPQKTSKEKWLEEALENARQELKDTVRQQQGMIFKFIKKDENFIHTLCDGELLYRLGLTPEHIVGKELYDFLPPADAEKKRFYYQMAWEGEEHVTYEREDNGIWYLANLRPIRRGGQVVEVIGSCVDITKRKKAEQAIEESEIRYRRLVELSPEPIVVHQEGSIQFANPAFIQLLGALSFDEIIGKPILDFSPPDYKRIVENRIRQLNREGILVNPTEEKVICLDGTILDVEVTGISFNYNGKPAYLMMLHDLTKRKEQEAAILKSEEKYRLITENMHDLIGVLDPKGVVQYASPSHETILGFPPEMYEGKLVFNMVHPDDIPHIQQQFTNTLLSKTPCSVEFRYKHFSGEWVFVEAVGTPVMDDRGEVKQLIVVARNISERKMAEELLLKSEKLSVVGQLAAGVAHEIRNPLTSIKGFVQLLQKNSDKPFYLDVMLSEIGRLEEIVKAFLSLAKHQPPHREKTDLKTLVQDVICLFETQALLNDIEITHQFCTDLPMIFCDSNQIKQVFIHILQNGVEAMPKGGVITIHICRKSPDSIKFRFIDQGKGIPEERIKKIGEPFFSTKEKGTGLGLMISQKIIQEHGGTLKIESKMNQGTMVELILPVKHSFEER